MPIINRIADYHEEITAIRHDLHAHPELYFDVHETGARVVEALKSFGITDITTGIGRTGIVAVIEGKTNKSGKVIALRSDMDALPLEETPGRPHGSKIEGKMHACGHDGHMAMLLAAGKYLAETRNFDGTAVLIFQPAEEGQGGAREMIEDGLMSRFNIDEVYGMHNWPGLPTGHFSIRTGPLMASADVIRIDVEGKGSHAAKPHEGVDTILVIANIIQAVQSLVSRNTDPQKSLVVSLCHVRAGFTDNVLPQTGFIEGTVRALDPNVRDMAEQRLRELVEGIAATYGARATLDYRRGYPVTVNHADNTAFAAQIASHIAGPDRVETNMTPSMGAEDFSYMLEQRPGAFIFVGNGDSAPLHHPDYDFNDELIPVGASYWVKIIESTMPA